MLFSFLHCVCGIPGPLPPNSCCSPVQGSVDLTLGVLPLAAAMDFLPYHSVELPNSNSGRHQPSWNSILPWLNPYKEFVPLENSGFLKLVFVLQFALIFPTPSGVTLISLHHDQHQHLQILSSLYIGNFVEYAICFTNTFCEEGWKIVIQDYN